jgi:LmbE family N-acetylglucosaminyl deacetylase
VILPYWKGRHPDHYTASKLGYEACFLAGLAKLAISHQPSAIPQDHVAQVPSPASEESAFRRVASAVASVVAGEKQSVGRSPSSAESVGTDFGKGTTSSRAAKGSQEDMALAAEGLAPHRPFKIIYATLYYDIRPTFVVDITDQFEARFESLMAYKSQFSDQEAGKDIFPAREEIRARIEAMARFYGILAGVTYAEPFLQKEVGLVEDVTAIPVKSI